MNVWQFLLNVLSHFTVFYFMSCLHISEWKAVPDWNEPLVNILMIGVTMKEINCKHNANCLNFYFYAVSCRINKSGTPEQFWFVSQWRCWEFLLNLNSLQSDFSVHFSQQVVCSFLKMKNNKGKHKSKNTMRTLEETVKSTYFPSKIRLQQDIYRQQHSLES